MWRDPAKARDKQKFFCFAAGQAFFSKKDALASYFPTLTAKLTAPVRGSTRYSLSPPAPLTHTANAPSAAATPAILDPAGSTTERPAPALIDGAAGLA
jgi:hypothetical protein